MKLISSKRKNVIFAWLLTFALVIGMGFTPFATYAEAVSKSEINALKKQQEQLAAEKAEIQKQADVVNGQVASQTEKLTILTVKLDVTNQEIENLSQQIGIYTNSIAEMENELNNYELQHQQLLEKYKQRIRIMEENGTISYLAILFDATSFTDMLSRLNYVKEVMDYDNGLINDVQAAKEQVTNAKADMEGEMADQQIVFASYLDKQADLDVQQKEVQTILSSLTASSADYDQQLASVKSIQSKLSQQISTLQEKLAEQERILAEQAAAKKLALEKNKWYGDAVGTGTGQDIVDLAKKFLGIPYVYGGTSPSGFDCSGLVYYCYKKFGYSINRTASAQALNGTAVSPSELKVGDIIIFSEKSGNYIGHCGLYIGNGQFIHAPHTGDVIKISSLSQAYYKNHFWGARRIIK